MSLNHITLWNQCLNIIKDNVPELSYSTWFTPIVPLKYEEKALFLATNPAELARIKQQLVRQKETSDLFKPEHFARDLEIQLQNVWQAYLLDAGTCT